MTLVEVLVVISLLLTAAGSITYLLATVKRQWQAGISRASVRQDLQTTLWQMTQEICNSETSLVTDGTQASPVAFGFPSAADAQNAFVTDTSGGIVWQKFVIYYIPTGTTRLLRKEIYQLPAVPPVQLAQADMMAYCDGTGTLVTGNARAMTIALDGDNGGLTLGLTLRNQSAHGAVDEASTSLYIEMRN